MYIDPIDEHRADIAKGDHARDTSYTIFAADMGNAWDCVEMGQYGVVRAQLAKYKLRPRIRRGICTMCRPFYRDIVVNMSVSLFVSAHFANNVVAYVGDYSFGVCKWV